MGFLENVTRDTVVNTDPASGLTVDRAIVLSNNVGRTSLRSYEVKFRPTDNSKLYRTEGFVGGAGDIRDDCFTSGDGGTSVTSIAPGTSSGAPAGMGAMWAGLPTSGTLEFEFYKIIQWLPDATSGFPQPQAITHSATDLSTSAVALLDSKSGGGWSSVIHEGGKMAERVIRRAFAGDGLDSGAGAALEKYLARRSVAMIESYGEGMLVP
jgi:hypothetical protein